MSSLRPTGRFLPFKNNIQRTQKQPVPAGFPQSLSGSETDISTSNENLSTEERYVIRHTARVEPQGQENHQNSCNNNNNNRNSLKDTVQGNSNRSSLKDSIGGGGNSNRSSLDVSTSSYNTLIIHNAGQDENWTGRLSGIRDHPSDMSHNSNQGSPYHTLINQADGSVKKASGIPLPISKNSNNNNYIEVNGQKIFSNVPEQGVQEITEIPADFLNQSCVLKHLAKEVASEGKTPENRSKSGKNSGHLKGKLSREKLSLSRSQPDLSSVGVRAIPGASDGGAWSSEEEDSAVQTLLQENSRLKAQLIEARQSQVKAQKLEEEVGKVTAAHEDLVGSCERRERLERAARSRLQADVKRLHDTNRALREQIELLTGQLMRSSEPVTTTTDSLRKELQNREMLIAQLITQNKELACSKERQDIEIAAQRATLQEQRTHIDILDTALTNAQANVVRLEEECRSGRGLAAQLQRALTALHATQLDTEIDSLRKRECSCGGTSNNSASNGPASSNENELKRALRARDEKILALQNECAAWEQRYLHAAQLPEEARIAAMERSSAETERLMAEARAEKIRHMDELHLSQKRVADLEGRVKELESKVAEREAMIKVLQKHNQSTAYDSTASLRNNSSREELVGFGASSSGASFSSAEGSRYRGVLGTTPRSHNYGTNSTGSNYDSRLDEQLAALESRYAANNRGLCCFPPFPGTSPRKAKIEQGFLGAFTPRESRESDRPEEILLLEKQGRTSQQQRAGSLPPPTPSSLPRPPRRPSASRLPAYGRLDGRVDKSASPPPPPRALLPAPRRLAYGRLPVSRHSLSRVDSSPRDSLRAPSNSSRESLVRGRESSESEARTSTSLPTPSKLAVYAAARSRRAEALNKTPSPEHNYRIRF